MATAQHFFFIVFDVIDKSVADMKAIEARLKGIAKTFQSSFSSAFDMNALSLTFFGMAIQRFFTGIARELFMMFDKLEGYNSGFMKATMHLQASWEFLKFAIINALSQPEFIQFVMNIVTAVDATSEWVQKNEDLVGEFAKIAGYLVVGGTILMGYGQLKMGFDSLALKSKELVATVEKLGMTMAQIGFGAQLINLTFAISDEETTVKDLIYDFLFGVLALLMGTNPLIVAGLMAITFAIRFVIDPSGTSYALGQIFGTFTAFSLALADIFENVVGQALERSIFSRIKAIYYAWKAVWTMATGDFEGASKALQLAKEQALKPFKMPNVADLLPEFDNEAFTKGYAETIVPVMEARGETNRLDYVTLKNIADGTDATNRWLEKIADEVARGNNNNSTTNRDYSPTYGYSDMYSISPAG